MAWTCNAGPTRVTGVEIPILVKVDSGICVASDDAPEQTRPLVACQLILLAMKKAGAT